MDRETASEAASITDAAHEASAGDGYLVRLDVFSGPFDLLLRLISQRRLDVYDVDLAEITAEFLAHLRIDDPRDPDGLGGLDLDTATRFLLIAATLIELKAVRLLPTTESEEFEDLLAEARDVLYARLLEYRAFREASEELGRLVTANAGYAERAAPLEPWLRGLRPPLEDRLDPARIGALAARLLNRSDEHVETSHIHHAVASVRDAAERILDRLARVGDSGSYRRLVDGLVRPQRIAHFLALLELYKVGAIELEQATRFADLVLTRRVADPGLLDALDTGMEA